MHPKFEHVQSSDADFAGRRRVNSPVLVTAWLCVPHIDSLRQGLVAPPSPRAASLLSTADLQLELGLLGAVAKHTHGADRARFERPEQFEGESSSR